MIDFLGASCISSFDSCAKDVPSLYRLDLTKNVSRLVTIFAVMVLGDLTSTSPPLNLTFFSDVAIDTLVVTESSLPPSLIPPSFPLV